MVRREVCWGCPPKYFADDSRQLHLGTATKTAGHYWACEPIERPATLKVRATKRVQSPMDARSCSQQMNWCSWIEHEEMTP
jgi:hypothetical protein